MQYPIAELIARRRRPVPPHRWKTPAAFWTVSGSGPAGLRSGQKNLFVARVAGQVDVDEFQPAKAGLLVHLEQVKILALDEDMPCRIAVHAVVLVRGQRGGHRHRIPLVHKAGKGVGLKVCFVGTRLRGKCDRLCVGLGFERWRLRARTCPECLYDLGSVFVLRSNSVTA